MPLFIAGVIMASSQSALASVAPPRLAPKPARYALKGNAPQVSMYMCCTAMNWSEVNVGSQCDGSECEHKPIKSASAVSVSLNDTV